MLLMQLLLILQELLLMYVCHSGSLHLKLLNPLQYFYSVKADLDAEICLQILISYVI